MPSHWHVKWFISGIARLGHTGAHALATRGCAPPVCRYTCELSALSVSLSIREFGTKRSWNRTAQYHYVYLNYESHMLTICKESMPQTPLNPSVLNAEFRANIVCPCCALASAMSWLHHCSSSSSDSTSLQVHHPGCHYHQHCEHCILKARPHWKVFSASSKQRTNAGLARVRKSSHSAISAAILLLAWNLTSCACVGVVSFQDNHYT